MSEYENSAKYYDTLLFPALQRIRKAVLREIRELNPVKIVDLCCGTGNQLKILHKNGFKNIYGVDLSQDMLNVAAKHSAINCQLEDATKTSFSTNEFDLAMISFALHEKPFEVAQGIVSEAKRLVKEGGYIIIVDYAFDKKARYLGKKVVNLVERNAGDEHYINFKAFNAYGGLSKLFDSESMIKEMRYHFGATTLRVYKN